MQNLEIDSFLLGDEYLDTIGVGLYLVSNWPDEELIRDIDVSSLMEYIFDHEDQLFFEGEEHLPQSVYDQLGFRFEALTPIMLMKAQSPLPYLYAALGEPNMINDKRAEFGGFVALWNSKATNELPGNDSGFPSGRFGQLLRNILDSLARREVCLMVLCMAGWDYENDEVDSATQEVFKSFNLHYTKRKI